MQAFGHGIWLNRAGRVPSRFQQDMHVNGKVNDRILTLHGQHSCQRVVVGRSGKFRRGSNEMFADEDQFLSESESVIREDQHT